MKSLTRKITLFVSALLLTTTQTVFAGPQGNQEHMQQMAQKVQECFAKFDESSFNVLEAKGKKMESEIKALCAEGKRDEAMSTAMKYGMEFNNDPTMIEMRKCSKLMEEMMGGNMPKPYMPPSPEDEEDGGHICDDM